MPLTLPSNSAPAIVTVSSKSTKGKKRTGNNDHTSTANKQARVHTGGTNSKASSSTGGTSNTCRATVATEEEDLASHGDDVVIEDETMSANESEAELGKI